MSFPQAEWKPVCRPKSCQQTAFPGRGIQMEVKSLIAAPELRPICASWQLIGAIPTAILNCPMQSTEGREVFEQDGATLRVSR